jgi:hypothetical protein
MAMSCIMTRTVCRLHSLSVVINWLTLLYNNTYFEAKDIVKETIYLLLHSYRVLFNCNP